MNPWRERLIAAGLIRPWSKELPPIQLPPVTVVFRPEPIVYLRALREQMIGRPLKERFARYMLGEWIADEMTS